MKSKITKKHKFIVINKKTKEIVMDETHIIVVGTTDILEKKTIDKYYNKTAFLFDYLKRAEMYFKSIHGDLFDENKLRCMIADTNAPIIFIYETNDNNQVFAIAPITKGIDD